MESKNNFRSFYQQFLIKLQQAQQDKNASSFHQLLQIIEPKWQIEEQDLYVDYCIKKASIYALFGENLDLDDWIKKALQFSNIQQHINVYAVWIDLYWKQSLTVKDDSKLRAIMSSLYNISTMATKGKLNKYDLFGFVAIQAFTLSFLGKQEEISQTIAKLKWDPIPSKLCNDKTKLNFFYAHIYKFIVVAIEQRNKELMQKLLLLITIDDSILLSKAPFFRKANTVIMDIADIRSEFALNFNTFYKQRKTWAGFLPNYSLFTMMIEKENIKGLQYFFSGFDGDHI